MTVIAVTGLRREARIVQGEGVRTVIGGGDRLQLRHTLEAAIDSQTRGIISIGLAGALAGSLGLGEIVIGARVVSGEEEFVADDGWINALLPKLPRSTPVGVVAGSDVVVADRAAKAALAAKVPGAWAVDMESHIAARAAAAHRIPFVVVRVISDTAWESLPPAALVAMTPDGGISYGRILRALLARPQQLPALLRTGWHAETAFAALLRCRDALGLFLGCPYLG